MEAAAWRRRQRVGESGAEARIGNAATRLRREHGEQQRLRIGMARGPEQGGCRRLLDDAAEIHDGDALRHVLDDGHTHIIGALQSGLHGLHPGHAPDWPAEEGIAEGTAEKPRKAFHSLPGRPRTISCFAGEVPRDWFA